MASNQMTTKTEHTPTPWHYDGTHWVDGPDGNGICSVSTVERSFAVDEVNAEFICLAVNNHEPLKKALTEILEHQSEGFHWVHKIDWNRMRSLLASLEKNNG